MPWSSPPTLTRRWAFGGTELALGSKNNGMIRRPMSMNSLKHSLEASQWLVTRQLTTRHEVDARALLGLHDSVAELAFEEAEHVFDPRLRGGRLLARMAP